MQEINISTMKKRQLNIATLIVVILFNTLFVNAQTEQKSVQIGNQIWAVKNLNVDKFRNGDKIKQVTSDMEWIMADAKKEPAWCYFQFDESNGEKYGKIYNGHAIIDKRGLAPKGWKIPSDDDWKKLESSIDKSSNQIKKDGDNSTGFSALYGGSINPNGLFTKEVFSAWSNTRVNNTSMYFRRVFNYNNTIERKVNRLGAGAYVRCIKD